MNSQNFPWTAEHAQNHPNPKLKATFPTFTGNIQGQGNWEEK